jgi:membrane glycosyltransferase
MTPHDTIDGLPLPLLRTMNEAVRLDEPAPSTGAIEASPEGAPKPSTPLAGLAFLAAPVLLTLASEVLLIRLIDFDLSHPLLATFILCCFGLLIFSVAYMVVCTVVARLFPVKPLPRADLEALPPTAIVYVVKNESVLGRFVRPSLAANLGPDGLDFWLLSNSDDPRRIGQERALIGELQRRHGVGHVHYFSNDVRGNPRGRKHLCIDQWLEGPGAGYRYTLFCDADSTLPDGVAGEFVRVAEHPDNAGYVAFQGMLEVKSAPTRYVEQFLLTASLCQRVYMGAAFRTLDTSPSFGHGLLVRNEEFGKLDVPEEALSHDIHDAVGLGQAGHRIAFCPEIVTWEEHPATYTECVRRETRWVEGTLQTLPLLFRPGVSAATRFYVLLPIYNYLMQPLLLIWLAAGFFAESSLLGTQMTYHHVALIGAGSSSVELSPTILPAVAWVVAHRFAFVRTPGDALGLARETLFSTLLVLNNVLYTTWAVFITPFKGREWLSMKKAGLENISWREATRLLWPSIVVGVVCVVCGALFAPRWLLFASPFVLSFLLAVPLTVWSSKPAQGRPRLVEVGELKQG